MTTLKAPISASDHVQGDPDAEVTLLEYADYECPYCGAAYPIVKRVQQHFGRRLRYVFRHFPLTEVHPHSESAAETAEFAGAHHQFWQMHDALFENQDRLGAPLYVAFVDALGLPAAELRDALTAGTYTPRVQSDFMGGVRSGVNGTPTFFINGQRHDGSYDFDDLVLAIDAQLASSGTRTSARGMRGAG